MAWAGVVYVLTNTVDGKQYVGKTGLKDHERRWDAHIKAALNGKSRNYVHRAIRKYGVEKFTAEVVQHCRTVETLNKAEARWIKKLECKAPAGYNMTDGGDGVVGYKVTKAVRKKMSAAQLAWLMIPGNLQKRIAGMRAVESRTKLSKSLKHYYATLTAPELERFSNSVTKALHKRYKDPAAHEVMRAGQARRFADKNLREANASAHRTPAFREKQRVNALKQWRRSATRRKYAAAYPSEKRSEVAKKWHADPEKHARQVAASTSVEARAKISNSLKNWHADPRNSARHKSSHRTPEFRAHKAEDARRQWPSTPEARKLYWAKIHPKAA